MAQFQWTRRYDDLGLNTLALTPAEFRTWITEDIQKWAKIAAGVIQLNIP